LIDQYIIQFGIFERKKNEDPLQTNFKIQYLVVYIKFKRMEWFGHVWRADSDIIKKSTNIDHRKKKDR